VEKMKKIICFTNDYDTQELKEFNEFNLEFIKTFDYLPKGADFYVVSLKNGSRIYFQFVNFMRKYPKSKFIFLNEFTKALSDEDFDIRDEPNAYSKMYTPGAALELIKELTD
jgi:hypothetical protein